MRDLLIFWQFLLRYETAQRQYACVHGNYTRRTTKCPSLLEPQRHDHTGFPVFLSDIRRCFNWHSRHFMPHDQFAEVARQLEETLSELNQVSDPALRRSLLGTMRLLIREADRLAGQQASRENSQPLANNN